MTVLILFIIGSCPPNKPPIRCPYNPCDHQICSNFPDAQCVLDNCGQCQAKFIINETNMTDQCSKFGNSNKNIINHFYCNLYTFKRILYCQCIMFKLCGSTCVDTSLT